MVTQTPKQNRRPRMLLEQPSCVSARRKRLSRSRRAVEDKLTRTLEKKLSLAMNIRHIRYCAATCRTRVVTCLRRVRCQSVILVGPHLHDG